MEKPILFSTPMVQAIDKLKAKTEVTTQPDPV
jgi:hypothetical protein